MTMTRLPLTGTRVVDFSWVFAGPTCTLLLSAMGAEVIKIESTTRRDTTRRLRAYAEGQAQPVSGGSFDGLNFGKKAITMNLSHPKAVSLVKDLVRVSDIVVENFSYGVMDRFGLGYQHLQAIKPDIIMLSFSLFGREGPDKEYFGFGGPLPVFTGLGSITGYPGSVPRTVGSSWPDPLNGVSASFAILAALHHRNKTGEGQNIDLSMSEGAVTTLPMGVIDYTMNQHVQGPMVNRDPYLVPSGAYRCEGEDRWVAIAAADEEQWRSLAKVMGHPEWITDERFAERLNRKRNEDALDVLIGQWTQDRDGYEIMQTLQQVGVACGPTMNRADLLDDPHLRERGVFVPIQDALGNEHPIPGLPFRLSGVPQPDYGKAPGLGENNRDVFCGILGLSEAEVERLEQEQILY